MSAPSCPDGLPPAACTRNRAPDPRERWQLSCGYSRVGTAHGSWPTARPAGETLWRAFREGRECLNPCDLRGGVDGSGENVELEAENSPLPSPA